MRPRAISVMSFEARSLLSGQASNHPISRAIISRSPFRLMSLPPCKTQSWGVGLDINHDLRGLGAHLRLGEGGSGLAGAPLWHSLAVQAPCEDVACTAAGQKGDRCRAGGIA